MKPVCLVIGAGAGIGGHVGKRFAAGGYHTVLCRRSDEEGLQRLVADIEAAGGSASGYLLNAIEEGSIEERVAAIEAELGDAALYVQGFVNGAESEGANVAVAFTGDFGNTTLAAEAANAHVANGADVMTGTAQMVVGAVGVAEQQDVLWFGTQSNQSSLAESIVVASQVYKWEVVLSGLIDKIKDGDLGGESLEINLANGVLVIEYNDAYDLPADVRQAADDAIAAIIDGSMDTGL